MRYSLALSAWLLLASAASAADVEHKFQSVVPRRQVKRVVIEVPYGTFTVRNGAAGRIALAGVASRDYDTAKERKWAQDVVNDTSVEIYVSGSDAIVKRKFGKKADGIRARKFTDIDLRLELPPGIDLEFETAAGEVNVAGVFGDIDIDLGAGEIDVTVPKAGLKELNASCRVGEVRTHIGNEVVTREGVLPGKTKYYNAAGKTHVNLHVTAGEVDVTLTQ